MHSTRRRREPALLAFVVDQIEIDAAVAVAAVAAAAQAVQAAPATNSSSTTTTTSATTSCGQQQRAPRPATPGPEEPGDIRFWMAHVGGDGRAVWAAQGPPIALGSWTPVRGVDGKSSGGRLQSRGQGPGIDVIEHGTQIGVAGPSEKGLFGGRPMREIRSAADLRYGGPSVASSPHHPWAEP